MSKKVQNADNNRKLGNSGHTMTAGELKNLYYLKKEIKEQQRRISELEAAATNCSIEITGLPRGKGISDKVGKYATKIADLKTLLEQNLEKNLCELNRLETFIQTVEDSEIRTILALRYIHGFTWQHIASEIGKRDEQYPRKKHNAFIRKFDQRFNNT